MKKLSQESLNCIHQLLDNFWVVRKENPELFYEIKQNEGFLRDYFKDYFRFKLVVGTNFAKVEKFQVTPQPSTGILDFKELKDYIIFYCVLAFLDGKASKQFTLSDVCQAVVSYYPRSSKRSVNGSPLPLTWKGNEGYRNRLSLVRVLKEAVQRCLIEVIDKNIEDFQDRETNDALLRSTGLVKYFMRNIGFNIEGELTLNDIMLIQETQEQELGLERKHLLYRKLFLEPALYRHEVSASDFDYLKQYSRHLNEHAEKYYDMNLDVYGSSAFLVKENVSTFRRFFPASNAESNLLVQFATLLRLKIIDDNDSLVEQKDGTVILTNIDLDIMCRQLIDENSHGWTTGLKSMSITEIKNKIKNMLFEWKLAETTHEGDLKLYDVIGRFFEKPKEENNKGV
ncbi:MULTISPECIES: TIGR02678 family protein [unclassified Paenibacillus]|uniref:TIGR02678 family protein n=1 Tax=unclassified Paenibacillus TaxID=185978 RepID=UPI0009A58641|nr:MULTISPECIES: TIGR02678 family protein [unclassified Paenibacillus]SLJ92157.1 TIGR02678 family protein [Paenibacillus sp. RU5A]SOC58654.1 TIGR02678 family protein [Paenibacillus sp. RU26A]SOC67706.1 TIGR02678 family protein [Paenibacillus sp. RU5M]